jgi:hypothetical protein
LSHAVHHTLSDQVAFSPVRPYSVVGAHPGGSRRFFDQFGEHPLYPSTTMKVATYSQTA